MSNTLKSIVEYFRFSRARGHTHAMIHGLKNLDVPVLVMGGNYKIAVDIARQAENPNVEPVGYNVNLRGLQKPLVIDHTIFELINSEMVNEWNKKTKEADVIYRQRLQRHTDELIHTCKLIQCYESETLPQYLRRRWRQWRNPQPKLQERLGMSIKDKSLNIIVGNLVARSAVEQSATLIAPTTGAYMSLTEEAMREITGEGQSRFAISLSFNIFIGNQIEREAEAGFGTGHWKTLKTFFEENLKDYQNVWEVSSPDNQAKTIYVLGLTSTGYVRGLKTEVVRDVVID